MNSFRSPFATIGAVALFLSLSGCGGGDGGGTFTDEVATISVSSGQSSLPLNVEDFGPQIGGPFTSTIFVEARNDSGPLDGVTFACNLVRTGVDVANLFLLDGSDESVEEVTDPETGETVEVPRAFRSVTRDSNAGGASFHLHAGDTTGSATIRCTVQDPARDERREATTTVQIGDQGETRDSQVRVIASSPRALVRQGQNGPTQIQFNAELVDEFGNRVPDPPDGKHNLVARVVPTGNPAEVGAQLQVGSSSGAVVPIRTINGIGTFTLVSGPEAGTVMVEVLSDRSTGIVDDGIFEPVSSRVAVPILEFQLQNPEPPQIVTDTLPNAFLGMPYAAVLEVQNGDAPYAWSLAATSSLPDGLTLDPSGVISGTPEEFSPAPFTFIVQVTDRQGRQDQAVLDLVINDADPLVLDASLPGGTENQLYSGVIGISGGQAPYDLDSFEGGFGGMNVNLDQGSSAIVVDGTPSTPGVFGFAVTVEDARGARVTQTFAITIADAPSP